MKKPELENGALTFDSFASAEILDEGAKLFMKFPGEIEQVFIDSLEPRWFYGYKSFSDL